MKLVRPIHEDKKRELERELERQKKRFHEATQASAKTIQENLSIANWIQKYPLQTAGILFTGGFLATQLWLGRPSQNRKHREVPNEINVLPGESSKI